MRAVILVVLSFSRGFAQFMSGDDTMCTNEVDASTLLQTKAYATDTFDRHLEKSAASEEMIMFEQEEVEEDECKGWCETVPSDWSKKCKWGSCKGCASCKPKEECKAWCEIVPSEWSSKCKWKSCMGCTPCKKPKGVCKKWCKDAGAPWSAKCGWKQCTGCSSCSQATPPPTPPTPPPPAPPPSPPPPSPPPANGIASGETGSQGTPGKVPDTIPDRFLNCHNYWRCIHGSPPIKWDKDVAQGSQEWANRGQMSHSDCYHIPPPQGPAGENLASGSSMSPEQACKMWHDESPERGPSCGGHCTAMLWKSAYKLGCGVKGGLVVCRYGGTSLRDGTPNFGGRSEYTQNVGYPDNSKEAECKKKWPLSAKGSANPGGGGGGGRNPFGGGGGGGGNPFGGSGGSGGGSSPFGGSGGGSSPFGGSGGSR